ncbi:MarR family winged helix-turn-helix transcriptional regulator [Martelella mediterranea]|uniref:MarR family transcriptional regulator n=1 Tax=Martelella mediterranea TaxID=293089 RepID=A0A4R3NUX6_9HYPH|nr:MarR family transcriptional regulator [Martelella mediterranea]TCT40357.1 MarR family transcriptional regulator [Martelella mediterranea]
MSDQLTSQYAVFLEALGVASRKMRNAYNARVSEMGLTYSRARVLIILAKHERINQSTLADELELERPTVVRMLDRMAELELVERVDDPQDRRANLIQLMPKGRSLAEELVSSVRGEFAEKLIRTEDLAALQTATTLFYTMIDRLENCEVGNDSH